jgi:pSer/pThr/pTyr-binding forkhead associated (FHA) protein
VHTERMVRAGALRNRLVDVLGSTNGTQVNGAGIGRCQLHPGDRIALGEQLLDVD